MEKKVESAAPSPPPSVADYDDSRSTYTVDSPPPAYQKVELPSVKVTKIVAGTLLLVTLIAGLTAVAIVYMQHNLKCAQVEESQQKFLNELPKPSRIVQEKSGRGSAKQQSTKDKSNAKSANPNMTASEPQEQPKKLNFPIHIDFDDITGKMMANNQRARLNCVIEKKRSEELIPRQPKMIQTPFGNLTTDPKLTHITGEIMSLTCRSGNERPERPVTDSPPVISPLKPILIRIPIQKEILQPGPVLFNFPKARPQPFINLIRPQMPLTQSSPDGNQSQLPQILHSPSHQVNIQGPFHMHTVVPDSPPPLPTTASQHQHPILTATHPQQQQAQQHPQSQRPDPPPMQIQSPLQRIFGAFNPIRIPLLPFPQMSFHHMIPHLLEVHKQIQMQREKDQKDDSSESNGNKLEQRQDQESEESDGLFKVINRDHPMMMHEPQLQMNTPQGRNVPIHDNPMQRLLVEPPFQRMEHIMSTPHMFQQEQRMPPPNGPMNMMRPHDVGINFRGHPNIEEEPQEGNNMERARIDINVGGHPTIHNNPHGNPPEEMMHREGTPFPFMQRNHNMQPRSPGNFRVKRMAGAGACSCVCE